MAAATADRGVKADDACSRMRSLESVHGCVLTCDFGCVLECMGAGRLVVLHKSALGVGDAGQPCPRRRKNGTAPISPGRRAASRRWVARNGDSPDFSSPRPALGVRWRQGNGDCPNFAGLRFDGRTGPPRNGGCPPFPSSAPGPRPGRRDFCRTTRRPAPMHSRPHPRPHSRTHPRTHSREH